MSDIVEYYEELFEKYGYHEKSLGWTKNKQKIRYIELMKYLKPSSGSLLDLGCGFADMLKYFENDFKKKEIEYYGVDIMQRFIEVAKEKYPQHSANIECADFLKKESVCGVKQFEWIIASGIFGYMIFENENEQYKYIDQVFSKCLSMSKVGIAFDFLSDKVDYRTSNTDFHAAPEKILEIAYKHSRRVILDNSVMPFEFTLTIFKNDKFNSSTTVFEEV